MKAPAPYSPQSGAPRFDEWLFLAFVAALPVMQPLNIRWGRYTVVPAELLFIVTSIALVLALLIKARQLRWTPWYWSLVLYAVASIASTVTSEDPRASLMHLVSTSYLIGAAFLTFSYVTTPASLRRALLAWVCGAAVTAAAAVTGIILFFAGVRDPEVNVFLSFYGSLPAGPYPRVWALFLDPNMLCTYLVASAMILVAARKAGWIDRRSFGVLLAGTLVATAFSFSPGIGGLFLAMSLWWAGIMRSRSSRLAGFVLSVGVIGAVAFFVIITMAPASLLAGLATGNLPEHLAPSARMNTWRDAWQTFLMHPWLGKGLGLEVAAVRFNEIVGPAFFTDAHNVWLSLLAQAGLVGCLAFVCVVLPLVRGFRLPSPADHSLSLVRIGLQLAFIGGFLYQTLSGSYEDTRHVWVLMGLVAAAAAPAREAEHSSILNGFDERNARAPTK